MPDITMCTGEGCEAKKSCYRYTAKPNKYQSYFMGTPLNDNECKYYINNETFK